MKAVKAETKEKTNQSFRNLRIRRLPLEPRSKTN